MTDPQFAEAVLIRQVSDLVHLRIGNVTGDDTVLLQRQSDGAVASNFVRMRVAVNPAGEGFFGLQLFGKGAFINGAFVRRRSEVGGNAVELRLSQSGRAILDMQPFGFDLFGEFFDAECLHENLDPRLVGVVATALTVIDPEDGFAIGQDVLPGQEFTDDLTANRRPAEAATDDDAEANLTVLLLQMQADIVEPGDGAVFFSAGNGDLELARQEGEFRMEGRPLAKNFSERARVDHFVGSDAGKLVGRDVAHTVTGRLDSVHLDFGKVSQNVRAIFNLRPVELHVVPGREVAVALVIGAGDEGQLA